MKESVTCLVCEKTYDGKLRECSHCESPNPRFQKPDFIKLEFEVERAVFNAILEVAESSHRTMVKFVQDAVENEITLTRRTKK